MWQPDVWAKRVPPGKVPGDAFGLCWDGERMAYYPDAIPARTAGLCWWVRDASFMLELAPMLQQVEAGIQIVLAPYLMNQSQPQKALAQWLAGQGEQIHHHDVVPLLQQAWHWPAYLQEDEWEPLRQALNAHLCHSAGLRCIRLAALDLYPKNNCQSFMQNQNGQSASAPGQPPAAARTRASTNQSQAGQPYGLRRWVDQLRGEGAAGRKQWLAADAFLQAQARQQLPEMARRLQACPFPQAPAALDRQIACLNQLAHLSVIGRDWPSLAGKFADAPPSERQLALLVAEGRRVAQELEQCQILLADTTTAPDCTQLFSHIQALAAALQRRRMPWWEVT